MKNHFEEIAIIDISALLIAKSDIIEPHDLYVNLADSNSIFSERLRVLSSNGLLPLEETTDLPKYLMKYLNTIIRDTDIWEENLLLSNSISISPETKRLIDKHSSLKEEEVVILNRSLIEHAYPDNIVKRSKLYFYYCESTFELAKMVLKTVKDLCQDEFKQLEQAVERVRQEIQQGLSIPWCHKIPDIYKEAIGWAKRHYLDTNPITMTLKATLVEWLKNPQMSGKEIITSITSENMSLKKILETIDIQNPPKPMFLTETKEEYLSRVGAYYDKTKDTVMKGYHDRLEETSLPVKQRPIKRKRNTGVTDGGHLHCEWFVLHQVKGLSYNCILQRYKGQIYNTSAIRSGIADIASKLGIAVRQGTPGRIRTRK